MTKKTRSARFFSLLLIAVAASSCAAADNLLSGIQSCPAVGSKACSGDPGVTKDQNNACVGLRTDTACGTSYGKLLDCAKKNVVCTDGKTDEAATRAACQSQFDTYAACAAQNAAADAGIDIADADLSSFDAAALEQ